MGKYLAGAAVLATAMVLYACGGGGGSAPVLVTASDTDLPANPVTTTALAGTKFDFPTGVPALGTTAATDITFSANSADANKPLFKIDTPTGSATGTTSFGSCIFAVSAVTGTVGTMHVGDVITVNPCNIHVATKGVNNNGVSATRSAALLLGQAVSTGATVTISVNAGGQLTINGSAVGTVTLVPVTG